MSFSARGTLVSGTGPFTLTPGAAGDVIPLFVYSSTSAAVTVSGPNVTVSTWVAQQAIGAEFVTVFKLVTTSVTPGALSITASGSPVIRAGGQAVTSTAGAGAVYVAGSAVLNATGTAWPSLTPAAGQMYIGFEFNGGSAVSGSTAGYVYQQDANANGLAYNLSPAGGSATSPVWGDSDPRQVLALLLAEAVKLPVAAQVTATGTALAPPLPLPAAAAVTAQGFALKPPGIPLPAAAAVTLAGHALPPAAVIPRGQVTAAGYAPAPPDLGYPDGKLGARVELLLGGTWTDITAAALPDGQQYGMIKGGQPDGAQQPSPGAMNAIWDNPDYSLSPRNADGPYFGQLRQNTPARVSFASPYGTYLRLEADNSDRAFVSDTAALHVTGSLELRLGVILSDWRPCVLAGRFDNTLPSWLWQLNSNGTFTFSWFDSGGTQRSVTSPAAAGVSWRAFRVTLDVSNGNVQFFLSDGIDGTWTSMGAAASGTGGSATSVRAGNAPMVAGWSNNIAGQMRGQVYGLRLYSGIGGTVVADAAFSSQVPGVTTWADSAGRTWVLGGGAEVTARDYRLHGEVASLNPTADVSSSLPRVQAQLAGRMRRLQQGSAPPVDSPMKRAILSQAGSLYPVDYWTMEDAQAAKTFGPSVGSHLLTASLGKVQAAADSSFEASAALPTLNGDTLSFTVDTYTGGTAWAVRFLYKPGSSAPGTASRLLELTTTGACTKLQVIVDTDGTLTFNGFLSGGSSAFSLAEQAFPQLSGPGWWSVEATPSGSNVLYSLVAVSPGAGSGNDASFTVTGHGSFGNVTAGTVNADLLLTDTVLGHLSVQKAWASLFTLGQPLNAWRTELAADRFARICSEQGITCRILGRSTTTQAMGPQPRGSAWTILRDCANTEQGMVFEPRDCFGVALRTRESLGAQQAGVTLSFASANLRGDLQPADDDSGFLNDVTGAMPDGTSWREVLDDGSAKSVSEPEDGGMGRYAASVPFPVNVADASELATNVAFYLGRTSVDEPRYRNVIMDLGIPGAPAAAIARLRPGDKVAVTDVPGIYQTADIAQLAMGWTEVFGPGRKVTWDCVQASPYA